MEEYQARSSMTQGRYKPIQELKKRAKGDENKQRRIANLLKHKEFVELFQLIVEIDGASAKDMLQKYKELGGWFKEASKALKELRTKWAEVQHDKTLMALREDKDRVAEKGYKEKAALEKVVAGLQAEVQQLKNGDVVKKLRADLEEALEGQRYWRKDCASWLERYRKLNDEPCQDCFIKDFKLAMLERKCGGAATGACKAEGGSTAKKSASKKRKRSVFGFRAKPKAKAAKAEGKPDPLEM